jgi:hypothetical protein
MRWLTVFTLLGGLFIGAQPSFAQGTERAFCLTGATSTSPQGATAECRYDTMAQCQASARGQSTARCAPNPKVTRKR